MIVDHKLILEGISSKGGWNSRQLEILGVEWPPKPFWQRGVVGKHISDEEAQEFRTLANQSCRKPRFRKLRHKTTSSPPLSERESIVIYCDGGCLKPKGKGAWSYVAVRAGFTLRERSMAYNKTTNNRMELMGAIAGILSTSEGASVIVRSDSQYVVKGIDLGWALRWAKNGFRMGDPKEGGKRPNWDLWTQLLELCAARTVKFEWIKGHNGTPMNEKCDKLAENSMRAGPYVDDIVFAKLLSESNGKW